MSTALEPRPVEMFVNLDAATRDRELRGRCVLFDLHGMWWSVPIELTLVDVELAITVTLDRHGLPKLPSHLGDVYRPKVA